MTYTRDPKNPRSWGEVVYLGIGHPAWGDPLRMQTPEEAQAWLDEHRPRFPAVWVSVRTMSARPFAERDIAAEIDALQQPPAAPAVPTDVVDQVAQAMCRADAVNKGRSFDEAVAPGIALWMRYRYEAEQLVGELPWLRTAALLAEQPGVTRRPSDRCTCRDTFLHHNDREHGGCIECPCPEFVLAEQPRGGR